MQFVVSDMVLPATIEFDEAMREHDSDCCVGTVTVAEEVLPVPPALEPINV